jgi:hypothetical protein
MSCNHPTIHRESRQGNLFPKGRVHPTCHHLLSRSIVCKIEIAIVLCIVCYIVCEKRRRNKGDLYRHSSIPSLIQP